MHEVWLPIDGFPFYEVSNLGRVRSSNPRGMHTKSADGVMKPWIHEHGYPMVSLYAGGRWAKRTVHSLVCMAFHGPKPTVKHEVAHNDGKPPNVRADNLRWALHVENMADRIRHGTHFNTGQFSRRLSDNDIREIRRLLATGMTQHRIASCFGIRQGMVGHIKTGRHHANVQ
jgi:hypothetical protein